MFPELASAFNGQSAEFKSAWIFTWIIATLSDQKIVSFGYRIMTIP
jgi:hypothetical protein